MKSWKNPPRLPGGIFVFPVVSLGKRHAAAKGEVEEYEAVCGAVSGSAALRRVDGVCPAAGKRAGLGGGKGRQSHLHRHGAGGGRRCGIAPGGGEQQRPAHCGQRPGVFRQPVPDGRLFRQQGGCRGNVSRCSDQFPPGSWSGTAWTPWRRRPFPWRCSTGTP